MYYPILRGRQFELIALRELLDKELLSQKIIPIVEPVKLSSTIVKTIDAFSSAGRLLCVVRNPQVGSFVADRKKSSNQTVLQRFDKSMECEIVIPAIYVTGKIDSTVDRLTRPGLYQLSDFISICTNEDYIDLYSEQYSADFRCNLILDESVFRQSVRQNRILLADRFKKKQRNVDYQHVTDESFSVDHLYCYEDGYKGFADYSVVGDEYKEAGFAPYAVVIHIVYFDEKQKLRVRHFVSETNDDINDPAQKFHEALSELIVWADENGQDSYALSQFREMYSDGSYPGLGTVKKLSIMHHLEIMGGYLDSRNDIV